MPKIFSESEKLSHKQLLFDRGLALIMERGYKNVTVDELIKLTGGSKGYFYLLFESKEDFFLKAVMWQMEQIFQALLDASQQGATPSELSVLHRQLYRKLKFANYEVMFYINQKVSKEQWQQFRKFEEDFFARIIKLMGSSPSERDPQIVSNLSALTYLSYMPVSSGETAQYWFSEKSDMVTDILLETIHRYITGH